MLGKLPPKNQRDLFRPMLLDIINPSHEPVLLADMIDRQYFEDGFKHLYSPNCGAPSVPLRLITGCLMLKQLYSYGDETLPAARERDVYFQYFCGMSFFEHKFPFTPSDFSHFRNRIGVEGFEKIFAYSVHIHGKEVVKQAKFALSDTTVQENSTTFPTDAKLCKKVIDKCNKIAEKEGIKQRQKYHKESKQCLRDTYNGKHPQRKNKSGKAKKRLKTMANTQLRELERKMSDTQKKRYEKDLALYKMAVNQRKNDKDKVYSLHKPFTKCIAKGKAHKPYGFGNKVGVITGGVKGKKSVPAIKGFVENLFDGHTIEPLLNQMINNNIPLPEELAYDRGGKGKSEILGVKILIPSPPKKTDTVYQKRTKRKKHRRRAAIEPIQGHLKSDFRMAQNYLLREKGVEIDALMSGCAWNLKKMLEKLRGHFLRFFFRPVFRLFFPKFPKLEISFQAA
jgi:IS5 family transposase